MDAIPELTLRLLRDAAAFSLLAFPAWVCSVASQHPSPKEVASPRASTTPVPQATPKPFPEPELAPTETGEVVRQTDAPATAPFGIKSDPGIHYLIKLTTAPGNEPVQTIFVRGGSTVQVKVPLGTFHIKYACGQKWYGYGHLFGPSTGYSQATEPFTFSVPGIDAWNAKMRKAESRILSFLSRSGLSLDLAREVLQGGFEKWRRWSELEAAIVKTPELAPTFTGLMGERRALQASEPTTATGYTITLYKVRDGNLATQKIAPEEFSTASLSRHRTGGRALGANETLCIQVIWVERGGRDQALLHELPEKPSRSLSLPAQTVEHGWHGPSARAV